MADDPQVPIVCSACDTRSEVPLSDVADALDRHNETVHDGTEHAQVDPEIAAQIADLAAEDLGLLDET